METKVRMILECEEFERAEINFQHDYLKLEEDEFSTIRGKTKYTKYSIGQIVKITKKRKYFCDAVVCGKELKKISELPLEFLKKDGEYPGFTISSHLDFVNLLNSFRRPYYHQATIDSKVSVFYLIKIT